MAAAAPAPVPVSNVDPAADEVPEGGNVSWKRDDGSDVPGIVYGDVGKPGIVLLQEWWGVTSELKRQAAYVASNGFRVLVPDLYRGALGVDAEEAHHLMSNLDWPGAVEDVRGAAKFLKGEGSAKVGIAGFCMGGALACAGATLVEEIDAGVVFYGTPDPALADPSRLTKPMQAHFGEGDHLEGFSNPDRANWLEEQFRAAGIEYEFHRYPRVGHAFMNSSKEYVERKRALGFGEHDAEAVRQAWDRFFAFCHKHLD